jgi:hypothetical protein
MKSPLRFFDRPEDQLTEVKLRRPRRELRMN